MGMMRKLLLSCWVLGAAVSNQALAFEAPPIPDKPEAEQFKDVPAPWRDYFVKARAAERIADPLQRCLAYPDLPDNKWPKGHSAAHCRHHFVVKRPTLDEIASLVEQGKTQELERMFDASLARHFDPDNFSDDIHDTFNYLLTSRDKNAEIDHITAAWLKQAPDSAYANLARGAYFNGAAWMARGNKWAKETPDENIRRMSELVDQAIPYFRKAVAIKPNLMPAYTGIIDMAMMDSRPELATEAITAARAIDPACPELATVTMRYLEPRWCGSYEEMLSFANELSGYLDKRPQLALMMAHPYRDFGSMQKTEGNAFPQQASEALDEGTSIGSDEETLRWAADAAMNPEAGQGDWNKSVADLLQQVRFGNTTVWGNRVIAQYFLRMEPELSVRYAFKGIALEPDNAFLHYLAGAGLYNAKQYEQADAEYAIAIEDKNQRQASLREVSEMWLWSGNQTALESRRTAAKRAKPYIDRLVREYPDDGRGLTMRFWHDVAMNDRIMIEDVKALLPKLDPNDPWQAWQADKFKKMIAQAEQQFRKNRPPTAKPNSP